MRLPASGLRLRALFGVEITSGGFVRKEYLLQNRKPEAGSRRPI
jgi:hypothetical protein